ncbi:hypothetical protein [Haloarchaeobius amylolyticus]|uniref:hypothetical protein n=1 Tax=Haloarchaeobius amylolyticus TaxID=1198296 RepID=UPI00226EEDDC|nr:hypothetical protein [Haloarchaeobius amylolyticus]
MDDTLERHLMAVQFLLLGLLVITFARFVEGLSTAGFGAVDALAFIGAVVGVAGMLGAHWRGEEDQEDAEPAGETVQGDGGSDIETGDAADVTGTPDPEAGTAAAEPRAEQVGEPATAEPTAAEPATADRTPVRSRREPLAEPGIRPRRRADDAERQTKSELIPTTEIDPAATSQYDPVGRATIDPATRPDEDPV